MPAVLTRLAQDHLRLVRLLDLFDVLLDRFHAGEHPDYDLMQDLLEYFGSYADTVHHPTEDLIFRRALERGDGQPEVFRVLMRQHAGLSQLGHQFREALDGILHGEVLLREDVETLGRQLVGTQRGHLRTEDLEAFPAALQLLTPADWDAIAVQAPSVEDPLFASPDPARFRALYRHLADSTRTAPP